MQRGLTEWVSFLHSPDEYLSNQRGLQDVEEVLGEDGFKLREGMVERGWLVTIHPDGYLGDPPAPFELMILFKITVWWDVMFSRSLEDIYFFRGGETS